jgi:hypothetical protein
MAKSGKRLVDVLEGIGLGRGSLALNESSSLLAEIVSVALGLALLLELGNNILVLPADLVGDATNSGVLATGLKLKHTKGRGNDEALDAVIRGRNTLEELDAVQGSGTTGALVGDHTTESLVEDAGGGAEMERTASRVDKATLAEVRVVLDYRHRTYLNTGLINTFFEQKKKKKYSDQPRLLHLYLKKYHPVNKSNSNTESSKAGKLTPHMQ